VKKVITLEINGKKIYADEGSTILEAARQNGIEIPTLCYHPRLEPLGRCRLCIVSIEGLERPVTSCDNPATDGMAVTTESPELRAKRSQALELFLATHPYKDCLTCVRTGTCELQENAYRFQVNLPEQIERSVAGGTVADNRYIVREEEKCILCGRCIQVCRSGPGAFVYEMVGTGVNTRVVPFRDGREVTMEEAGCIFCGQCADVCPVAAITEAERYSGGREWELSLQQGVCIECSLGCYLERQSYDGKMIRASVPREGDKVGWLCRKGKFGFQNEPGFKPLEAVLKLDDGIYRTVNYEEAIRETAEALMRIKENSGSEKIALLASGQLSNEESYLLQKLARSVLDTPNIDLGAEYSWVHAFCEIQKVTGKSANGLTPAEISKAGAIMVVGSGLEESHPVAAMAVGRAGRFGGAVIIRTASDAESGSNWQEFTLHSEKSGDYSLFNSLTALAGSETDAVEDPETCGLTDDLRRAADLISRTGSCIVVTSSFLETADKGTIEALVSMAKANGIIERGRSRMLILSKYSNAAGILASGGTVYCGPGFAELNRKAGMAGPEIESAVKEGGLKGLLLFGREYSHLKRGRLEHLAAVCSAINEAPDGADLLYPAQPAIHREGLFTNSAGQTLPNKPIAGSAEETLPGWRLICDLARAMGAKWKFMTLEDIREEMKSLVSTTR
jgi:predicted molibdopterin-dependent oxidoreductase YjgC